MKSLLKKIINKETITYIIFGVLTTLVNYVVCFLFYKFTDVNILVYNVVAWIAAVIFAFITNKLFVFESKSFAANVLIKELITFTIARVLSLGMEELFLFITVTLLGMNEMISKLIAQILVVIVNYVASKLFIFKKKEEESSQ